MTERCSFLPFLSKVLNVTTQIKISLGIFIVFKVFPYLISSSRYNLCFRTCTLWEIPSLKMEHITSTLWRIWILFLKILFIYFQREGKGEREGEKHQCVVASLMPPTEDQAWNPGMCPDWGIKPVTLWFAGQSSVHWATPAKVCLWILHSYSFAPCALPVIFPRGSRYQHC